MSAPVRYRRRPPEIEALQLTADNALEVAAWCGGSVDADGRTVCVAVTQSVIRAYPGDYVARDVDHTGLVSHYPIKGAVLAHCYEPLEEG